ncbi:MAG: hypothetical protein WCG87_07680 [Bacteroidota bacterium]
MEETMNESNNLILGVRWTARIMTIIIIAFVVVTFMDEGFTIFNLSPHQSLMVMAFFLAWLGLVLAWLWEGLGAIMTLVSLILYVMIALFNGERFIEVWVCVLPAILFLFCWFQTKNNKRRR